MFSGTRASVTEQTVHVAVGSVALEGNLWVPRGARGVVLFAHGSGSSRHSPRNRLRLCQLALLWISDDGNEQKQRTGRENSS